jgi:hypothetical protein
MVTVSFSLEEDYWQNFNLQDEDLEFIYNYLLESETPLGSQELVAALVDERIRREKFLLEQQRSSGGDLYQPKGSYAVDQNLVFPALGWQRGRVVAVRPGHNPDLGEFGVVRVAFDGGVEREFATGLADHILNDPPKVLKDDASLNADFVLQNYLDDLVQRLEEDLVTNPDFVRIAGRWFPRALLVDVNIGHLNLAEAVLDMANGGPMPTEDLARQIGLTSDVNPKLLEFSLDFALESDGRFDEVGPSGKTLWFLHRLEPAEVLEPPMYLRYAGMDYDRSVLTKDMLALERELDDELSPLEGRYPDQNNIGINLIFPHWRSGTLPLSARLRPLFPTAYEAPRIRFMLVDGDNGEQFPGWVVREKRYVFGLREWYIKKGLIPGSLVRVQRGSKPGEVILHTDIRRSSREWMRTVLVGSDGGIVFAMLKQAVTATYDERMAIALPDVNAVDQIWLRMQKERAPFERIVVNMVRELAKLDPQSHVHASELYAAVNVIRRCPPGPLMTLLASRPWFVHVGDLHYRFNETELV